jgi:hypothetical protein
MTSKIQIFAWGPDRVVKNVRKEKHHRGIRAFRGMKLIK